MAANTPKATTTPIACHAAVLIHEGRRREGMRRGLRSGIRHRRDPLGVLWIGDLELANCDFDRALCVKSLHNT